MISFCDIFAGVCRVIEVATNETRECIFPFIIGGKIFFGCVKSKGDSEPKCSTLVDQDGRHVLGQGKWGNCGSNCPIHENGGKSF